MTAVAYESQDDVFEPIDESVSSTYGCIPGTEPGFTWPSRKSLAKDGVHRANYIMEIGHIGPYSIILTGSRNLFDLGYVILFSTGEVEKKGCKWTGVFNRCLMDAIDSGMPVRIIRSSYLSSPYAPAKGFRYDGLYIICCHKKLLKGTDKLLLTFVIHRNDVMTARWLWDAKTHAPCTLMPHDCHVYDFKFQEEVSELPVVPVQKNNNTGEEENNESSVELGTEQRNIIPLSQVFDALNSTQIVIRESGHLPEEYIDLTENVQDSTESEEGDPVKEEMVDELSFSKFSRITNIPLKVDRTDTEYPGARLGVKTEIPQLVSTQTLLHEQNFANMPEGLKLSDESTEMLNYIENSSDACMPFSDHENAVNSDGNLIVLHSSIKEEMQEMKHPIPELNNHLLTWNIDRSRFACALSSRMPIPNQLNQTTSVDSYILDNSTIDESDIPTNVSDGCELIIPDRSFFLSDPLEDSQDVICERVIDCKTDHSCFLQSNGTLDGTLEEQYPMDLSVTVPAACSGIPKSSLSISHGTGEDTDDFLGPLSKRLMNKVLCLDSNILSNCEDTLDLPTWMEEYARNFKESPVGKSSPSEGVCQCKIHSCTHELVNIIGGKATTHFLEFHRRYLCRCMSLTDNPLHESAMSILKNLEVINKCDPSAVSQLMVYLVVEHLISYGTNSQMNSQPVEANKEEILISSHSNDEVKMVLTDSSSGKQYNLVSCKDDPTGSNKLVLKPVSSIPFKQHNNELRVEFDGDNTLSDVILPANTPSKQITESNLENHQRKSRGRPKKRKSPTAASFVALANGGYEDDLDIQFADSCHGLIDHFERLASSRNPTPAPLMQSSSIVQPICRENPSNFPPENSSVPLPKKDLCRSSNFKYCGFSHRERYRASEKMSWFYLHIPFEENLYGFRRKEVSKSHRKMVMVSRMINHFKSSYHLPVKDLQSSSNAFASTSSNYPKPFKKKKKMKKIQEMDHST